MPVHHYMGKNGVSYMETDSKLFSTDQSCNLHKSFLCSALNDLGNSGDSLFSYYSEYSISLRVYRKKGIDQKPSKAQGDAAKDLIAEMNIRHNNALLVQEIGKATSSILDIDKLIKTVVNIMEIHMDFDRGMILLANSDKNRLYYACRIRIHPGKREISTTNKISP